MDVWFALGWLLACLWWGLWWRMRLAVKRVACLRDFPPHPDPPGLSIVVAASNEEHTVQAAMSSLLALDYPDLQVIVVNDRSTDRTGDLLERLAARDGRLTVHHVRTLPPGWLGKTHALQQGAGLARHELILFTDADVHFSPDSLRRAVAALQAMDLDHLVVTPWIEARGLIEQVFVSYFNVMFQ
ncbi:glycosyltransferase, partial [bacterium CPR1]|nr:glycosyltransferase [bacterium CPR1]